MNDKLTFIFLFLAILLLSCTKNYKNEITPGSSIRDKKISDYASKFNAIINWQDSLRNPDMPYTVEIQKYFSLNKQPVLLETKLDDIILVKNKYYIELRNEDSFYDFDYFYKLSCDYQIIEKILSDSISYYYTPILIANIKKVYKGYRPDIDIDYYDEYDVSADLLLKRFIILEGKCIETIGEIK